MGGIYHPRRGGAKGTDALRIGWPSTSWAWSHLEKEMVRPIGFEPMTVRLEGHITKARFWPILY